MIKRIGAGTALSKDAIWEEFSERYQHQKSTEFNAEFAQCLVG